MVLIVLVAAYLLGSIPVAWIVTRLVTGKDLRQIGSGNVGVMNVALSVHRWAGFIVFVTEILKGVLAVLLPRYLGMDVLYSYLAVIGVVVGTRWPIWLGFHGGRGNSAGVGALLVLSWQTVIVGGIVWLLIRAITRNSFWASRIAFFIWPLIFAFFMQSWSALVFAYILVAIYLSTQRQSTDDHLLIKEQWPSLFHFLFSPPRE